MCGDKGKRKIFLRLVLVILVTLMLAFCFAGSIEKQSPVVEFSFGKKSFTYIDKEIVASNHIVAQEIFTRKINHPLSEKLLQVDYILTKNGDYKKALLYCFPLLEKKVAEIERMVNLAPKNAELVFYPNREDKFDIKKEQYGRVVDQDKLYRDIYISLRKKNQEVVKIEPRSVAPEVFGIDLEPLTNKISSYKTSFASSGQSRSNNIALALKKINGARIEPGEEFSFNKIVGPRTLARGFTEAKIIVGGEYANGVGGGVCQVSTTLYNAAILADMQITEVSGHSLAASYVPYSQDAMVNSGSSDLRFINKGSSPVFIRSVVSGNYALIEFYGKKLPYKISVESRIISTTEPPPDIIEHSKVELDESEESVGTKIYTVAPRRGTKSEAYLIYKSESGTVLSRKKIREDTYKPIQGKAVVWW